jgi:hypothetical protein
MVGVIIPASRAVRRTIEVVILGATLKTVPQVVRDTQTRVAVDERQAAIVVDGILPRIDGAPVIHRRVKTANCEHSPGRRVSSDESKNLRIQRSH